MGDPYTSVTVANYNLNPPPDDGTNVPQNIITWAFHKSKLSDPIKTAVESINTNLGSAVDRLAGGITSAATDYTILGTDQGKLIVASGSTTTITTATAATVGTPFECSVLNNRTVTITLDGAGSETIDGNTTITLPPGAGVFLSTDGTNWFTGGRGNVQGITSYAVTLPRAYLAGLGLSNGTDADHDIDIAVGTARDFANSFNFSITSTFVKRIDASWVAGTGNGGLASAVSLSNATWYHVFLVDDGSGNTDAGYDTSATATNLLSDSGGTLYRRLGSVLTDGTANILAFIQVGDHVYWDLPTNDFDASITGGGAESIATLSTPLGVRVIAGISVFGNNNLSMWIRPTDITDTAPEVTTPLNTVQALGHDSTFQVEILTDTSSQISLRAITTSANAIIATHYYIDSRGRND